MPAIVPPDVPVLIVGGGPSGLLQSYLLSRLGVKCLIVERYPTRLGAPKAHALSPRSLEICRQFGLDVNHIRSLGTQRKDAFWVNFITNLSGQHVGLLPYERMDPEVLDATPEMIHNIPQPTFEDVLSQEISSSPLVEIRKNVSFVSCRSDSDGVITTVEERDTKRLYDIHSKHVIACDGARSKVREYLKIESEGEDSYETMMTIHFNADLRPVVGEHLGMLHWVMDPDVSGFIIGYDLSNNQVLICNFDPEKKPLASWDEDLCRKIVEAAIGQKVPFDVLGYRPWVLSRKVARRYRSGNIFLAGDAAHSFPPTGGLGLNSGLADVHNLAYKIAAVHHGWGKSGLLDTYEDDRKHVAEVNSQQSVKNGKKIFTLLKTLGTTDSDIERARENLYHTINDPKQQSLIQEQIEGQREHFDNLKLHIGYVYGNKSFPPNASNYTPKYVPGARLPHTWINIPASSSIVDLPFPAKLDYVSELSPQVIEERKFSTLDLSSFRAFTFIVATSPAMDILLVQIKTILSRYRIPIVEVRLGLDFTPIPGKHGEEWVNAFDLKDAGGLVVRPDQHILKLFSTSTSATDVSNSLLEHLDLL